MTFDFSRLPPPDLVRDVDFETILAQRKARLLTLLPPERVAEVERTLQLESEPMTILLQEAAYAEMLFQQRVNEAAVASMLATAQGADLDNRAADYGVARLLITPAAPAAVPPVAAVWESDQRLRLRAQMALEGLSVAGPRAAYVFHALSVSANVADVAVHSPEGNGVVHVYVLDARNGGVPDEALLAKVGAALSAETVRPLCDKVTAKPGEPIDVIIHARIEFEPGGETLSGGLDAARARLAALLRQRRALGQVLPVSAIDAALHSDGVRRVQVLAPAADVVCALQQFPRATTITLERWP
ncbi:baseplate assembly protein [Chitiniphilus shinanonensis]|uniref:Baseplate assembly protein n=1 Tax=Chitiniphilus shinanonensis TaxID=553088 RepID=A0ABQ6BPY0_9NEIS|nr:baseplate J/gp47 family protein [Chitiniphilus shinanonensis]GLS03507.1 baseplate assembly protein [Chitiniphilus shinanonensis]